jgi:hypothetical protein
MFCKNEMGLERVVRTTLGLGLITWGFQISGNYWLDYALPIYQVSCWEWTNYISNACLVERGFSIAVIGLIPVLTGIVGWCPLKAAFGIK